MHLLKHYGVMAASMPRSKLLDPYLDTMSARPSGQHMWLYNRFLLELQAGNAIPTGYLCHIGGETSQAAIQNMARPSFPLAIIGSPTFTANQGFVSSAIANRLETTDNNTTWPGLSASSYMIGVFCNTSNASNLYDCGLGHGGSNTYGTALTTYTTTSNLGMYWYPVSGSYFNSGIVSVTSSIGMSIASRIGATSSFLMRDGTSVATSAITDGGLVARPASFLGNYTSASGRQQSIAICGAGFSTVQAAAFCTAVNRLLSAW